MITKAVSALRPFTLSEAANELFFIRYLFFFSRSDFLRDFQQLLRMSATSDALWQKIFKIFFVWRGETKQMKYEMKWNRDYWWLTQADFIFFLKIRGRLSWFCLWKALRRMQTAPNISLAVKGVIILKHESRSNCRIVKHMNTKVPEARRLDVLITSKWRRLMLYYVLVVDSFRFR